MDENSALVAQILMEDEREMRNGNVNGRVQNDGGWQTVTYSKRNRKQVSKVPSQQENSYSDHRRSNGVTGAEADVFKSIEQHSEDRHRRIAEEKRLLEAVESGSSGDRDRSKRHSDEDDGESDGVHGGDSGAAGDEVKKVKVKKVKKPKVTVAEAAAKLDAGDLGAFLVDITVSTNLF